MKICLLLFINLLPILLFAETYVYFENSTPLTFSVTTTQTGTHSLSSNEWNISASSIAAWEGQKEIMWTNRNSGIHNGDDFFFDMVLNNGSNSITLQLKLNGNFSGSDMWTSAAGTGFNHPWYDNNNFHQETFTWGSKTYTLKYHSYFTGGYDDVFFALQEHDPFPINSADTSDPNVLNILAYNIFMLTPPVGSSDESDRANALADHIHGYDAIIFSEAFYNSARSDLQLGIAPEYPYMTAVVDDGTFNDDGGVFIASRFPILHSAQMVFSDCNGSDCLAAKGVMYAKINKHGRIVHLFGTHTQAWTDPQDVATRISQLSELQNFISSQNIPANEAVLIGGDLNVDKIANHLGEYDGMLDSLNLMEPTFTGHPYTYDPSISSYASGNLTEFLDYVMTQNHHLVPLTAENKVIILRSIDDDMFNNFDLSDHLAVHGRFTFPVLSSTTSVEVADIQPYKVFPNPNTGRFRIDFKKSFNGTLQLINPVGQVVFSQTIQNQSKADLDASNLAKGLYYLQIQAPNNVQQVHKILIR